MNSNEAHKILLEVLQVLEGSALDHYSLAEVQKDTANMAGYSVIVTSFLGSVSKQQIREIAEKYSLEIKDEKEGLTLYKTNSK